MKSLKKKSATNIAYTRKSAKNAQVSSKKKIYSSKLSQIRLNEKSLAIVLHEATKLVKHYYEEVILKYNNESSKQMFMKKCIEENDWTAFAGQLLEAIFGDGILVPLEETHDFFNLEIDHLNLNKYTAMIANSEIRDDLDLAKIKYSPKSESVSINIPECDLSMFSTKNEYLSFVPERTGLTSNLSIPTSLPESTALVAVITYNQGKEANQKIKYNFLNEITQKIEQKFN